MGLMMRSSVPDFAYGFTMSSSYNTRPRTCEILVDGDSFTTIRKRETYEDLITGEKEFLS